MTRQRNFTNIAQNILTGQAHLRSEMVVLNVSREKILSDTIYQGEKARDANIQNEAGVRREFFMLVIEAILDPCYGMVKEASVFPKILESSEGSNGVSELKLITSGQRADSRNYTSL